MNLIAIDTATEKFSVALSVERQERADTWLFEADAGMRHSELVMDAARMLTQTAALEPKDIGGVVCMGGPGSFTGLRIGFSIAKGLALSLGVPFAPIPTLDCLAWPVSSWRGIAVPVLDAKKKAFFCALYREGRRLGPGMDATPDVIARVLAENISPPAPTAAREQVLLFGPGARMLYGEMQSLKAGDPGVSGVTAALRLGEGVRWGNAETLLEIARELRVFAEGRADSLSENLFAGPEYIRKSDAELNALPKGSVG